MADEQIARIVTALNGLASSLSKDSPATGMRDLYGSVQKLNNTMKNLNKDTGNSYVALSNTLSTMDDEIKESQKIINRNLAQKVRDAKAAKDVLDAKAKSGEKLDADEEEELKKYTKQLEGFLDKDGKLDQTILDYYEQEVEDAKKLIKIAEEERAKIQKKLLQKSKSRNEFLKGNIIKSYADLEEEFGTGKREKESFFDKLFKLDRETITKALQTSAEGKALLLKRFERDEDIRDASYEELVNAGMKAGDIKKMLGKREALKLTGEKAKNIFDIKSGRELGLGEGGLANKAISAMAPPWVTLLLAAFNRFNEIGKKALQLFEGTAGRYGYGEGFNKGEAKQFLNFQGTARDLSAQYAVNLEQVEEAFKGLQEYSGVRTFGQLKKLAEATLQISNATGLATTEVTKLGSAYQKNFGYSAQESVAKAGKQLLGLMNSVNSGLSSNLVLTNTEMAGLVQNLIEGTQGADVTKTLLPFIDTAYNQIKGLGIQSKVVGELLRNQMLEIKKSGGGLPGSLSSFMLGAGGLFTNRLGGAEVGIASQVGRGKFAYEQGQEMAKISTGPGREFWSSPKLLLRNDLVDLAFKLKGGDLAGLLASQSDAALSGITQRVYELYQIPGAAEAIGVSLLEITEKFSTIARNNPLQFKMLGGDLDKLSGLSEYAKAEATIKTGRVGGTGPIATEEQLKAANDTRKAMVAQMTPVDRTNQYLETIVGLVDKIVVWMFTGFGYTPEKELEVRGGLTKEQYDRLSNLNQIPQRNVEQQKQYDLLRATQTEFRGNSAAKVDPVSGKVTTTVEMSTPQHYGQAITNAMISGANEGHS